MAHKEPEETMSRKGRDTLSKEEIQQIAEQLAPILISQVRESKHEFWIDPEKHYNSHRVVDQLDIETIIALKEMVTEYRTAKGIFWKAFIATLSLGAVVASIWVAITGHGK